MRLTNKKNHHTSIFNYKECDEFLSGKKHKNKSNIQPKRLYFIKTSSVIENILFRHKEMFWLLKILPGIKSVSVDKSIATQFINARYNKIMAVYNQDFEQAKRLSEKEKSLLMDIFGTTDPYDTSFETKNNHTVVFFLKS